MRRFALPLVLLALVPLIARTEEPAARPGVSFSILPKSLQKNPEVYFNVVTEMTEHGRRAPQPTPTRPIRYLVQAAGYRQLGQGASAGEKPPAVGRLEAALDRSLAAAHYRPADDQHPPQLVLVVSWGSHSSQLPMGEEAGDPVAPNEVLIRELIERARLVGGDRFAREFVDALAAQGAARRAMPQPRSDPTETVAAQPNVQGEASGMMTDIFSPVELFRNRTPQHRALMEDVGSSIYFVVASAYDAGAVAADRRVLLWRTYMSVNSQGIGMRETLPALVAAASPYFGRDMTGVEIVAQRLNRGGRVEVGTPEVVEFQSPGAPPPTESPPPR